MRTSEITKWDPFKITSWNPFNELNDLQNRLTSLFHRTNGGNGEPEGADLGEWTPAVDISEDDNEFTIVADLPKVKKEDVRISVDDGMMTISGERKHEEEEKKKKYHRIERHCGQYTRSFRLPDGIDEDKIDAAFEDGELKVHLPKSEEAKHRAREIAVK